PVLARAGAHAAGREAGRAVRPEHAGAVGASAARGGGVSAPVLADRYVLAEPLGHGGFAEVYRARDRRGGAQVAVKVLCVADDPGLRARFHQEALLLAGLDHPHVVRALAYAVDDAPRP